MLGKRILLIEADIHVRRMMQDLLSRAGCEVSSAADGPNGLQLLFNERPDMVILDVNMHESDGWQTFQQIRLLTETPVIILASSSDAGARARALEMGATEFVGKPFGARSLLAQVKNVLECHGVGQHAPEIGGYEDNYLSVDTESNRVLVRGEMVRLTRTELRILNYLVANSALLVTFEEILREVWGPGYEDSIDYIHVYISRLRRKIEERPRKPKYIISEHGLGYRFNGRCREERGLSN
jgi:two-component system KDP operon response regulator KdpE